MIGVERLPMSTSQKQALPLALRVLYFKNLPPEASQADLYRVDRQGALVASSLVLQKPLSRI